MKLGSRFIPLAGPVFVLLSQQPQGVRAWAEFLGQVECPAESESVTATDGKDICLGEAILYGPSPTIPVCPDDTDEWGAGCTGGGYVGGWSWHYEYATGLAQGTEIWNMPQEEKDLYFMGDKMSLKVEDDKTTCSVIANGVACNSCTICDFVTIGRSHFSADCTNVDSGRLLECEMLGNSVYHGSASRTGRFGLFYPFQHEDDDGATNVPTSTQSSSGSLVSTSPVASPTDSPTSGSVATPTDSPTSGPVAPPTDDPASAGPVDSPSDSPTSAPVTPPTDSPTSAPVASPGDDAVSNGARVLSIDAYLEFTFFPGTGREPSDVEIGGLLDQMTHFFAQRLQDDPTFPNNSWELEFIDLAPQYDASGTPDEFRLDFEARIAVSQDNFIAKASDANASFGESDFKDFLANYVRKSAPLAESVFGPTFKVFFKGISRNNDDAEV